MLRRGRSFMVFAGLRRLRLCLPACLALLVGWVRWPWWRCFSLGLVRSYEPPSFEAHHRQRKALRRRLAKREDVDVPASDLEELELELPTFEERKWRKAPSSWPAEVAELFVPLGPHTAATRFVETAPVASWLPATLYNVLCELPVNEFDLQACLYPKGSHLFTAPQLRKLLKAAKAAASGRVLDVGAGDGCHTAVFRMVSEEVVATETSQGMAWQLEREGYEVWCEDVSETFAARAQRTRRFSLVSMLNVLDRCTAPRKLMAAARGLLEPGGFLLLASPLPFAASYYGPETSWNGQPLEDLSFTGSWDEDGLRLVQEFLPSCGFHVKAVSRLPYLSGGDVLDGGCIELDDIVVLAQKATHRT
ncbi:METTL9 [Symbiodinium sp. CCMP2456]|nr:METTL9 [Symbiodinium sp. CCMP2456]